MVKTMNALSNTIAATASEKQDVLASSQAMESPPKWAVQRVDMDEGWVCDACHSINAPSSDRCYSCKQSRSPANEDMDPGLWRGMQSVCPRCGAHRGMSRVCQSCGLSFDDLALAALAAAASRGPGSLGRLLFRRVMMLMPFLLLGIVVLVVGAIVTGSR